MGSPSTLSLTNELKNELERLRKLYQVPEDTRPVARQKKPKKKPKKK